ncbi:palmitoleoyl-protein carboxylesterase NOTUM-like isoform X2 [Homarus americanus]|uniref:palmitoleoyl-protein carboxylesterase NOTUM-like isoform X2 n=1 Tax=Homarus americanus TaxID=6706 RepID=UPI001C476AAB|nr:palmitoleoyl-protein carboxylesterase NOTUM-like isoform X2 [Homarus americanus]
MVARSPCWCWCRLLWSTVLAGAPPWALSGGGVLGATSGGTPGALTSLGALGSGPLDAVVGPRLMTRLVETEAVQRVAAARERECCGLVDPTTTPLTLHWLTRPPRHASSSSTPRHAHHHAPRAVCNDNSPAGFYFRQSEMSRRWIVFLEGGWYCFDRESCEQRWRRLRPLMTSRGWPDTRHVGGILSPHPEENPHWWTANHVFVPYCSSDSWSGTRRAEDGSGEFSFMGSVILEEVVKALVSLNFTHGHKLILAGSSAGGVGVLVNVDHVARQLEHLGILAEVRAVSDSGWFLDNEPFAPLKCVDAHSCPPVEAIRRGQELWQGRIPDHCRDEYPRHPWYCYFGYRLYPTLKSPLFVFQWMFDEAQMTADNVGKPNSKEQWDYIHGIGERLRKTFENVTALFAPSCISHTVLTKRNWASVKIGEVSLPQALYCWDITPSDVLAAKTSRGRGNNIRGVDGGRKKQTTVQHHRQRQQRTNKKRDRGNQREGNGERRRTNNQGDSERRRHGRRRGKKRKSQASSRERSGDSVQSSPLVLESPQHRVNGSGNSSYETSVDTIQSQETIRQNILSGEMLADSPKNSLRVSSNPGSPYLVESNSIDTPQENVQIMQAQQRTQRPNKGNSETSRKGRRQKRKRRRKDRERKKRKRERRRKRRERRRKRLERKKRREREREKGQGRRGTSQRRQPTTREGLDERQDKWTSDADLLLPEDERSEDMCPTHTLHLTDRCAWPHCNHACPKLLNPFTGEEMNFTELLKSFGLDMASVANALGIDIHTLNSMGNNELLLILTQ